MTVSNVTNRTAVVGTGAEQTVSFSFPIVNNSDITVSKRLISTGVSTELSETTHYTVTNNGDDGGSITTVAPFIGSTYHIYVVRNTARTQSLDLEQGGSFNAENVEAALDKNARLIIENTDANTRSLRAPSTDAVGLDMELPNSVVRASKNLGFDASGNPTVTDSSGTFSTANAYWDDVIVKSPIVDVRAFGADTDSADNATVIQAAVDSLTSGGVVYFPEMYDIGTSIKISANLTFIGNGWATGLNQVGTSGEHGIEITETVADAGWVNGVFIKNMLITGNALAGDGVVLRRANGLMESVKVTGFTKAGSVGFNLYGCIEMVLIKQINLLVVGVDLVLV